MCLAALQTASMHSHFILTLSYYYLHLTDEKVEAQSSRQFDLTTALGILPLNYLQQMPTMPPSVMTHSLGLSKKYLFAPAMSSDLQKKLESKEPIEST